MHKKTKARTSPCSEGVAKEQIGINSPKRKGVVRESGVSQSVFIISLILILGKTHIEAAHITEVHLMLRSQEQAARRARRLRRCSGSRHRNAACRAALRGLLLQEHGHVRRGQRKDRLVGARPPHDATVIRIVFRICVLQDPTSAEAILREMCGEGRDRRRGPPTSEGVCGRILALSCPAEDRARERGAMELSSDELFFEILDALRELSVFRAQGLRDMLRVRECGEQRASLRCVFFLHGLQCCLVAFMLWRGSARLGA